MWRIMFPFLFEDHWLSPLGLFREAHFVKILKVSKIAEGRTMWEICFIHSHGSILVNNEGVMGLCDKLNGLSQFCYGLISCTITTQSKTFSRMCKLWLCKTPGPLYQGLPMGASFSHKAIALVQMGRTVACPLSLKKKDQNQNPFTQ
jgi:hypothetical protein